MKTIFTLLITISYLSLGYSQVINIPDLPYTRIDQFTVEGNNIIGFGTCDQVITSTDGGITFSYGELDITGFNSRMVKVPNTNGTQAYVVYDDRFFIIDVDMNITDISTDEIDNFGDFNEIQINEDHIFIVADGAIWKSPHSTYSWTKLADVIYDDNYSIRSSSITESYLWIGTSKGNVFKTHLADGGYVEVTGCTNQIRDIEMVTDDKGYFYCSGLSHPMKTTDGGLTWNSMTSFPENNGIIAVYGEDVVILSNTNRYFYSLDGGETVTEVNNRGNDRGLVYQANFSSDGKLYLSGTSSTFIVSEDFGATNSVTNQYSRESINSITLNESGVGIATGTEIVMTTTDNGDNWNFLDLKALLNLDYIQINSARPLSDGTYAISTDDGLVKLDNGTATFINGLSTLQTYHDEVNDFILAVHSIGTNRAVAKSIDGGQTWNNLFFSDAYLNEFRRTESGSIYISSSDGPNYSISHDDGETWEEIDLVGEDAIRDIHILGNEILFAANRYVYLSTDGGESFDEVGNVYLPNNVRIIGPGHYTYTSAQNSQTNIFERKPEETSFEYPFSSCGQAYSNSLNGTEIWYGRNGGHIMKYDFNLTSTASKDVKQTEFQLTPNVISCGQDIQLPADLSSGITEVISANGKAYKSIINKGYLSTSELANGLYFISIELNGKIFNSKFIVY